MSWEALAAWMSSFGEAYGVDPLIFALLYFGTIPFSLLSFSMMIRNHRSGKPIFWPVLGAFFCFIGTYIYLFAVGRNIPLWVYVLTLFMMLYSARKMVKRITALNR